MAKLLILTGIFIVVLGLLLLLPVKSLLPGRLPGDITIERKNFTVYIPLATSLLISLLISVVIYLVRHWKG
jgi:hypothetical protein